jgi:hypothetical protein
MAFSWATALEFRRSRVITFDSPSFPLFEPDPPPGESCFDSERIGQGAQNCLRFDQIIANAGQAPLELRFALPLDPNDSSKNVSSASSRAISHTPISRPDRSNSTRSTSITTTRALPAPRCGNLTSRARSWEALRCVRARRSASAYGNAAEDGDQPRPNEVAFTGLYLSATSMHTAPWRARTLCASAPWLKAAKRTVGH